MKKFPKEFLQEQLGYFIYYLLNTKEKVVEIEFAEKYVNQNVPFSEELLSNFEDWLSSLFDDLKEDYPKTLVITSDSDGISKLAIVEGILQVEAEIEADHSRKDWSYKARCPFCNSTTTETIYMDNIKHEDSCIYLLAKQIKDENI